MGIRGEIYSEQLEGNSGRRTYFYNVKEDRHGTRFLALVESAERAGERIERQQIVIYEEDLDNFRYELNKAFSAMKEDNPQKKPREFKKNKFQDRRQEGHRFERRKDERFSKNKGHRRDKK